MCLHVGRITERSEVSSVNRLLYFETERSEPTNHRDTKILPLTAQYLYMTKTWDGLLAYQTRTHLFETMLLFGVVLSLAINVEGSVCLCVTCHVGFWTCGRKRCIVE